MKVIALISFVSLTGCNIEYSQQQIQCMNLCNMIENTCGHMNHVSFEYELCYDYCAELSTRQEVDNFQACSECYMAIECNDEMYGSLCFPACEGDL